MARNDRKKKKDSLRKERTQAQQEQRRRLNEWMALVRRVCVSAGVGALFDTLTEEERSFFETTRVPPMQLRRAPGHTVPPAIVRKFDHLFNYLMDKEVVVVPPGGDAIPLVEYVRATQVIRFFHAHCERHPSPRADRWVAELTDLIRFDEDDQTRDSPLMRLMTLMNQSGALIGDLDKVIYPIHYRYDFQKQKNILLLQWYEISTIRAQHRHFGEGRDRRRSFRVFVQTPHGVGPYEGTLSTRMIPHLAHEPERALPVYAQEHVRVRMRERLAPLSPELMDYLLGTTLMSPGTIPSHGGAFLLSLEAYGCRLGYVVAVVVEDPDEDVGEAVLMRTFLFVTQSGTPGGDRLSALLNVSKFEKSYFGLDRLDMFLTSDLCHDLVLQQILRECGVDDLIGALGENRQLRACVQNKGAYAGKLRHWLNLDEKVARAERVAQAAAKEEHLLAEGEVDRALPPPPEGASASRASTVPLRRRLRILRRGLRRPFTAFVRRLWIPCPPAAFFSSSPS